MTTGTTSNELAVDNTDGLLPAPRRRAGGRRGTNNNLSSSFKACTISHNSDDPSAAEVDLDSSPPKRRATSRRDRNHSLGNSLGKSLQDRGVGGIERTEGRLSVSFSDQRGLSSSAIADILSGSGLDHSDEPGAESEKHLKALMDEQEEAVEGRDSVGSLGGFSSSSPRNQKRQQLSTIISQKIMKFDFDPNEELNNSDEE